MAYVSSGRNQGLSFGARINEIVSLARESLAAYRIYRETHRELSSLSDRELSDLGIARSMITRISMDAAYGEDKATS